MLPTVVRDHQGALLEKGVSGLARAAKWVAARARRWRERRRFPNRVRVLLDEAELYLAGPTAGTLTLRLKVVNFTGHNLTVEQTEVEYWQIAGRGMQNRDPPLRASGRVPGREVDDVTFSITLHPADVEAIGAAIPPVIDPRSCPDVRLVMRGSLVLNVGRRRERKRFELNRRIAFSVPGNVPSAPASPSGGVQPSAPPQAGAGSEKPDYSAYRALVIEAEPRAQQAFDRTIITLSGGALGVSFAFVEKFIRPGIPLAMRYLAVAWGCWVTSLILMLASHYFSALAMRKTVKQIDSGAIELERPGGWYDLAIVVLNPLGGLFFVAGAVLAGAFVLANVR